MVGYVTCTNFKVELVDGKLKNDGKQCGAEVAATPEARRAHLAKLKCASYSELITLPSRFSNALTSAQTPSAASRVTTPPRISPNGSDRRPPAPTTGSQPQSLRQNVADNPVSSTQRTYAPPVPSSHAGRPTTSMLLAPPVQGAASNLSAAGTPNSMAGNAPSPVSSANSSPKARPVAHMGNTCYDLLGISEWRSAPQALTPQGLSTSRQYSASPRSHQSPYSSPSARGGLITPAPPAVAPRPASLRSRSSPPSAQPSSQSGAIPGAHSRYSSPMGFTTSQSSTPMQQSPQSSAAGAGRAPGTRSSLSRASSAGPPTQHLPLIPECQHVDRLPSQRMKMCKAWLDTRTNHSGFCSEHYADAAKLTPVMRNFLASAYNKPLGR